MNKMPIIELAHKCLSIRFFKGKAGTDIYWGEYGKGVDLFVLGIGEFTINFTSYLCR